MPLTANEITKRFTYHAPIVSDDPEVDQPRRYEALRQEAGYFASLIVGQTPESREQSLAITHLEEAVFWANAAIARNEASAKSGG